MHEIWASEVIGSWPRKGGGRKEGFNIIRKEVKSNIFIGIKKKEALRLGLEVVLI